MCRGKGPGGRLRLLVAEEEGGGGGTRGSCSMGVRARSTTSRRICGPVEGAGGGGGGNGGGGVAGSVVVVVVVGASEAPAAAVLLACGGGACSLPYCVSMVEEGRCYQSVFC